MSITVKNPEALAWKHPGVGGISTKAGVITEWPKTLPALTQADVDAWELEYETIEVPRQVAKMQLQGTDADLARILEDALTVLKTVHNIDLEVSLPAASKAKLAERRANRAKLK